MPIGLAALLPLITGGASALGSIFGGRPPANQFGSASDYYGPLLQELTGRGASARDSATAFGGAQRGLLESQWPSRYLDPAYDLQSRMFNFNPVSGGAANLEQILGTMGGNLNYINQYGLPGSQQLQGEQQGFGGAAGSLLGTSGGYGVSQLLQQILGGGLPNQQGMEGLFGPTSQMGLGGAQGALGLTSNVLQNGLPGQQAMAGSIGQNLGQGSQALNQAYQMLGQGPQGNPYLQQLAQAGLMGGMQGLGASQNFAQQGMQGLPGQSSISSLVDPLARQGMATSAQGSNILNRASQGGVQPLTDIERQSQGTISGMLQGGGLSPEFVSAMRKTILDPAREQLVGNLSAMSGGQASLASPAYQELLRKQESDFADRLLTQGFQNLGNFAQMGLGAGAQSVGQQLGLGQALGNQGQGQIGSALGAFGAVPQNQLPFAQLGAQTGSQMLGAGAGAAQGLNQGQLGISQLLGQLGLGQQSQGQNAFNNVAQNVLGYGQLSGQMGSNLLGQATNQFGAVPGAVAPFANMANQLGLGLNDQSLQRYSQGNSLGLNALQTIQNLAFQPYNTLQQNVGNAFNQNFGAGMDLLNAGQRFTGQQQSYDLQQQDMLNNLIRQLIGGSQQEQQMRAGSQASRGAAIGQGIGGIIPSVAGIFRKRGDTTGSGGQYPG